MEIGKYLKDVLKKGKIEDISDVLDHFFKMVLNGFGMLEQRQIELEKRIVSLERGIDTIGEMISFQQQTINQIRSSIEQKQIVAHKVTKPKKPAQPIETPASKKSTIETLSTSEPLVETTQSTKPITASIVKEKSSAPTSQDEILAFRKSILKPTPILEKEKPKPISIRAELLEEMKGFMKSATKDAKKEKNKKN